MFCRPGISLANTTTRLAHTITGSTGPRGRNGLRLPVRYRCFLKMYPSGAGLPTADFVEFPLGQFDVLFLLLVLSRVSAGFGFCLYSLTHRFPSIVVLVSFTAADVRRRVVGVWRQRLSAIVLRLYAAVARTNWRGFNNFAIARRE